MTPAQGRKWKRDLARQIKAEHKRAAKEKLSHLREQVKHARHVHRSALTSARERCKADRIAVRVALKARRAKILAALRNNAARQRANAKETCAASLRGARALKEHRARARAELKAERDYRAELRRIDRTNRQMLKEHHASAAERRSESDEEVAMNIPANYRTLWNQVRKGIRGTDRMTRTEAFLKYAEENPRELLESVDDATDRLVRELERRERAAAKSHRKGPSREVYSDVTPF